MAKMINLIGKRYGRLLVTKRSLNTDYKRIYWVCKCDCGATKDICGSSLKSGITKSCGCLRREISSIRNDLTGKVFGKLTAIKFSYSKKRRSHWECKCECGTIKCIAGSDLSSGHTKSCGCIVKEGMNTKHGMSKTPEHKSWLKIRERCLNHNDKAYKNYGGRGIKICDEWENDFQKFYDHVGKRPTPKHSIDRIDNDGNYECGNVRWATRLIQANNKRNNVFLDYDGERKTIAQWSKIVNIDQRTLQSRLSKSKWSIEKALSTPLLNQGKNN